MNKKIVGLIVLIFILNLSLSIAQNNLEIDLEVYDVEKIDFVSGIVNDELLLKSYIRANGKFKSEDYFTIKLELIEEKNGILDSCKIDSSYEFINDNKINNEFLASCKIRYFDPIGKYKIKAMVDPENKVKEVNENNNVGFSSYVNWNRGRIANINYDCNGCSDANTCYPIGYRIKGKDNNKRYYCADDKQFVLQVENGKICENDFECQTNLCVSKKCVNTGFFDKLINFFKNWL